MPQSNDTQSKKNWSLKKLRAEIQKAFPFIPRALSLVWQADPRTTLVMAGLTLISAVLPVSQAWVGKLIVDQVVLSLSSHQSAQTGLQNTLPYLYLEFAFILAGTIIGQLRRLLEQMLNMKLGYLINTQIIRKALKLDLHYFENAEFYDRMQNARKQSEYRAMTIMNASFLLVQNIITLFSFLVLILAFSPWVAILLFAAALPAFVAQNHFSKLNFRLQGWQAPESRRMSYLEHLLTVDSSAKEIKLFQLGEPLLSRYSEIFWRVFHEDTKLAWRSSWVSLGWGILGTISFYGCYAWIIFRTAAGLMSLGSMTLYLSLFRQSQGTFNGIFDNLNRLYESGLFMENLFSFLALKDPAEGPTASSVYKSSKTSDAKPSQNGIEFRGVSFRYPGQENWALSDVNLKVGPGEKVALVGENGSGKTTLIKLLTRLYDPTEGEIYFNGKNLKEFELADLHRKIGVIFQDFVRYQFTLKENIGFGAIDLMEDETRLTQAAQKGGALEVIHSLKEGWQTTLGGWFQKGRELSGGQWQKIALSRAFMREGEVIVLDEPTSALDAEREYEIFQQFKDLTFGKIAFLISHRFSTVRMADRIIVLKAGQVIEAGTHQSLMEQKGTYAHLFELQAQGYR